MTRLSLALVAVAVIVMNFSRIGYCAKSVDFAMQETARFALVLGVNDPESTKRQRLRYADDDALAMHQLLEEAGTQSRLLVRFDEETAKLRGGLLSDGDAPLSILRSQIESIRTLVRDAKKQGLKTEVIFFYSGHGDVHKGEGYVVLQGGRLTRTVLFEEVIEALEADSIHVIIDACKSYYLVYDKGPGGTRTPYHQSFAKAPLSVDTANVGFVLSASSGQSSHEWERYQAGVFSYEVRSAFRGGADVNSDGRITYAELGAFLTTANAGIINERFLPQFLVRPPRE